MKEKLSVIIPCYNVEKIITKTIESLNNQTYNNIEIILIDDCSTDNTYKKLLEFKNQKNIKIFKNEKNSGAACSRNFGIKIATSDYIGFIDSDDEIPKNYYEVLMQTLIQEKADVVVTDIISVDEQDRTKQFYSKCYDENSEGKLKFINVGMAASSCNKVFKKELLEKYSFLEGKINEDIATIIPILIKAKKISYTNKTQYYYIQRKNSVQHKDDFEKKLEIFDAVDRCFELISDETNFEKYKQAILYHQLSMLYFFVISQDNKFFSRYFKLKKFIIKQEKYKLYDIENYKLFLEKASCIDRKYFSNLIQALKDNNANKANIEMQKYKIIKFLVRIKNFIKKSIK